MAKSRPKETHPDTCAEYKLLRNKITFVIRKSTKHYYRNLISENVKQPAKLWNALKQVLPQGKSFVETLELNDAGNVLITNKGIAAHFIFLTVGKKLAEKFRGVKSKIEKKLDSLDVKKATGLDEINPQFLRDAAPIVCAPLADIFINSMLKGSIPQSWKNAKVALIFKAGDPTDMSNYRPISVIPVIMKVFERIVHNQLSTYLNDTKLLYEYQSGFRSKFSTDTTLIDVTEYIVNGFDSGEQVGAVMIHLKKSI